MPEATAMGFLFLGLNITAVALTLLIEQLKTIATGYWVALYGNVGLCMLAILLTACFKPDYK